MSLYCKIPKSLSSTKQNLLRAAEIVVVTVVAVIALVYSSIINLFAWLNYTEI